MAGPVSRTDIQNLIFYWQNYSPTRGLIIGLETKKTSYKARILAILNSKQSASEKLNAFTALAKEPDFTHALHGSWGRASTFKYLAARTYIVLITQAKETNPDLRRDPGLVKALGLLSKENEDELITNLTNLLIGATTYSNDATRLSSKKTLMEHLVELLLTESPHRTLSVRWEEFKSNEANAALIISARSGYFPWTWSKAQRFEKIWAKMASFAEEHDENITARILNAVRKSIEEKMKAGRPDKPIATALAGLVKKLDAARGARPAVGAGASGGAAAAAGAEGTGLMPIAERPPTPFADKALTPDAERPATPTLANTCSKGF